MDCPSNSLKTVVAHYIAKIKTIYPQKEAESVVWLLIEHFFDVNRLKYALDQNLRLNESELLILHNACKKILQHIPVQYVIGKTDFCGLSFAVNTATLIPRPETEQLTELVLKSLPLTPVHILDIGTGSGCIAVTLKKYRRDCEVFACDIHQEALLMAQKNAKTHNTHIHFFHCDILSEKSWSSLPQIDLIVSNPPYVCFLEKSAIRPNVLLYEPETALFVDDKEPLLFYEAIVKMAVKKLVKGGKFFFEVNERFGNEASKLLHTHGFPHTTIKKDFRGKDRFVIAV
jgi:release factor glutamine methyltransferase